MSFVSISKEERGIAVLAMERGKVNALEEQLVGDLSAALKQLASDDEVAAVILTGRDKWFSFGFDIPLFLEYSREDFTNFLIKFTALYSELFAFPKPIVCALNGHCIAAGCMLAAASDYRVMVPGKNKIGINELGLGASVFAGTVEMLKFCVGRKNASKILYSASLFSATEALALGLVDRVVTSLDLRRDAFATAAEFASKNGEAFAAIKRMMRRPVLEAMARFESHSIHEFVDIWYSERTRERLATIKIYD